MRKKTKREKVLAFNIENKKVNWMEKMVRGEIMGFLTDKDLMRSMMTSKA